MISLSSSGLECSKTCFYTDSGCVYISLVYLSVCQDVRHPKSYKEESNEEKRENLLWLKFYKLFRIKLKNMKVISQMSKNKINTT